MMLITYLVMIFKGSQIELKSLIPWLFFLQDYFAPQLDIFSPYWRHTWSLAAEEQFYIFLPLLLIFLSRISEPKNRPFKLIPGIFAALSLACLILRYLTTFHILPDRSNLIPLIHFPFHLRMDSLFFGVLLSYFYHYRPADFKSAAVRFKYVLLILGLLLFIPPVRFTGYSFFTQTFGYALVYLGSGMIFTALLESDFKDNPALRAATFIGYHSYSIYLWHQPFSTIVCIPLLKSLPLTSLNWLIYALVYLGGSVLTGVLMGKCLEQPILKLRDRFFPSRSGQSAL